MKFIEVKLPFDFSDNLTMGDKAIIVKHLEAMSVELEEEVSIVTFLNHRIYPESIINDGTDSPYELVEAVDTIKEQRRHDKIKALKARKP